MMNEEKNLNSINLELLENDLIKPERLCFMCFRPLPSKKAFGRTNLFRTLACDDCYEKDFNKEEK